MKKRKKRTPTKPPRSRRSHSAGKTAVSDRRSQSRGKPTPKFFAERTEPGPYGRLYARVHLRNKRGDVYLVWKDGNKVRSFYVGRRKYYLPTVARPAAPDL